MSANFKQPDKLKCVRVAGVGIIRIENHEGGVVP